MRKGISFCGHTNIYSPSSVKREDDHLGRISEKVPHLLPYSDVPDFPVPTTPPQLLLLFCNLEGRVNLGMDVIHPPLTG